MDRIFKILELILKSENYISVDFIAENLKVSNKTIRNDLFKIEKIVKESNLTLNKKPGVGIAIEGLEEKKLEVLNNIRSSINYIEPYSPEDRLNYILKALFMSKTSITMKELSDSLYISRATLLKDLEKVDKWLSNFKLRLIRKTNYGIEVTGKEEDLRKAIASLLDSDKEYNNILREIIYEDYDGIIDYTSISKLKELVDIDYRILEKIVTNAEAKLNFKFSDEAFVSLIIHIAIAIKRLNEEKDVKLSDEMLCALKENEEYETALQIALDIQNSFNIKLPESEIGYILLHILGTKLLEGKSSKIGFNFENESESELAVIMAKEIINVSQRALHINLSSDKQLLNGLILHLRPTINRLKYGLTLHNTILKEIKENYIEIFGAAWMTNTIFERYLGITMPEEEIGYICLHLAAAVERNKNPIKVLVVCASGIGTSQFISARLERSFRQIDIVDVISIIELKRRKTEDIDLVISTVPVECTKPVLMISPLLNQNDIRRIELFIEDFSKEDFEYHPSPKIIDKSLIKLSSTLKDMEALIREMCTDLIQSDYIQEEFVDSVFEREVLSPTEIGWGIAIPHGDTKFVNHSCLAVNRLKEPITWGSEKVDTIFLLCIKTEDRERAKKWVRSLYNFIENDKNRDILKKAKNSEEIYSIMEEFLYVDK
ncbi:BglG family transcription antiterminator [Candidatus Clostridium radicumherbarum]|uniref:BglG family transcription antiterminator n=1 Tax=Candidatus Clostridium radicumherbarum TaxID=3381662 RepID=A0ABW8TWV0_9CLOT